MYPEIWIQYGQNKNKKTYSQFNESFLSCYNT